MTRIRVLFIEDEAKLVEDLPVALGREGFDIVGTTDVEDAQRLFMSSDFDVVLTDIAMPPGKDMDSSTVAYGRETGIVLSERLHAAKPKVPIIALTVIRDEKLIVKMRRSGVVRVLNKPEDVEAIIRALRDVTSGSR